MSLERVPDELACLEEAARAIAAAEEIAEPLKPLLLTRADLLVEFHPVRSATARVPVGGLGWSYWAVRNDQIDLLRNLSAPVTALVTYTTLNPNAYTLIAALLFAALELSKRLRNKSIALGLDQYRVLLALKQLSVAEEHDLVAMLIGTRLDARDALDRTRIHQILQELKLVRAGDGTTESLVVQAADGKWSSNGV